MPSKWIILSSFVLTSCLPLPQTTQINNGSGTSATLPHKRALSLYDRNFTTCQLSPQTKIFHFPMYHNSPDGQINSALFEKVTRSQFQLLHTLIINYGNIVIFSEQIQSDSYYSKHLKQPGNLYFTRLDQKKFLWAERIHLAKSLFTTVPLYYEHLTYNQKQYIYDTGGILTLFFMGYVDHVYKTISSQNFSHVIGNFNRLSKSYAGGFSELIHLQRGVNAERDYWLFDYRENLLKQEVLKFYQKNPNNQKLVFIAYGMEHDLSDDFIGFSFSTGSNCLQ